MGAATALCQGVLSLQYLSCLLGSAALLAIAAARADDIPLLHDGAAAFVVSDIKLALAEDADKTGACPKGMSLNAAEIFAMTSEGKRRKDESDEQYGKRLEAGAMQASTMPNGQNACLNPEASAPDPHYRTVDTSHMRVDGIDLDGVATTLKTSAVGTCPHQDFVGLNGERGVDNQLYRVV